MARAEITELKKKIEKIEAALVGFESEGRVAEIRVCHARRTYRDEIILAGLDPMDANFRDALSSKENSDDEVSTTDNQSEAGEA